MKQSNISKEDIINLEKKLKELTDQNAKFSKEKKNLEMTNEYLNQEIDGKKKQIVRYMKSLSNNNEPKIDKGLSLGNKKANLYLMEEQIVKLFYSIQKNCNAHLQDKHKTHIEYLYNLQKEMKVSYIIIKKLDIKEDFLKSNKLVEFNNLFDNFKNLAKIGRLNYFNLKSCGPILMYRINLSSTFDEIKIKCCDIWNLSSSAYSLYDDSFNNLECVNDSRINEFFASFQPNDPTLGQGQVVFYLIEKLKHQRELLETQDKSIDSKSDISDYNSNKTNNLGGNDLENCLDLIKSQKILKGIENFKIPKVDIAKRFIDISKMVDNNIIYILINILLLIVTLFSIANKKNVSNWSYANWQNKVFLNSYPPVNISNMYDGLTYFIGYADVNNQYNTIKQNTDFIYYGPSRFRFFKTNSTECFTNFAGSKVFANFINTSTILCYNPNHDSTTWNATAILTYPFVAPELTNISHIINTPIGKLDQAGVVIDIWDMGYLTYNNTLTDLYSIANSTSELLPFQVQAIELMFTLYSPSLDVFLTNLFVVQRDINQAPYITVADSIPFVTNVYETTIGQSIKTTDLIRCAFLILLLTSIPIRIYQKFATGEKKGVRVFLKTSFVVILQIKSILLILATLFLFSAVMNYLNNFIDTVTYYQNGIFNDLYDFANKQKEARALDQLSMYLISLYSLKYLQYLENLQILFISFKKATFEYFSLIVTICIIFIGLSILTNFVFGSYIYEYKNFLDSIMMNIKIFIFIENTSVTTQFLLYYRVFSIIVIIIFIFLIRYFLLNLFFPIFIEYYRIEVDKYNFSKKQNKIEGNDEELTFGEKLGYFVCFWKSDRKKKKVDGIGKEQDIELV